MNGLWLPLPQEIRSTSPLSVSGDDRCCICKTHSFIDAPRLHILAQRVAQTSCFPRSAAFLAGTWEDPQTCKRRRSALLGPQKHRNVKTFRLSPVLRRFPAAATAHLWATPLRRPRMSIFL
jgi:hypothetical protein